MSYSRVHLIEGAVYALAIAHFAIYLSLNGTEATGIAFGDADFWPECQRAPNRGLIVGIWSATKTEGAV